MSILDKAVAPDGTTHYVRCLQVIASLMGKPAHGQKHKVFLSASDWAKVAYEMIDRYSDTFVDPLKPPTPENFKTALIGGTLFINSGIEDAAVVSEMNATYYRDSHFDWRKEHLISGRH